MAITRRLVLVQAPPNQVASGTIEGHCGMYFVSDTDDLLLMSEMLVHESSHQYFNLLALLDNSVQANHVTEYYSPFPRRMRNLDRILIAYHAFANVAVLYEELKAQGHYERHLLANRNLLRDVKQIEDILKKDREYLTEVGKGMFDPLLARREALCAVAA
jgi:HEXXH motif-containing protein